MNAQDLKETAKLDYDEVTNSSVLNSIWLNSSMLKGIIPDAGKWMDVLAYDKEVEDNDCVGIKNWLRYRICTKLHLYTVSDFDCDTTEDALNHCDELLKNAGFTPMHTGRNKRHIAVADNGMTVKLETDTMNSMQWLFGEFMRRKMESKYGNRWLEKTYMKEFGLKKISEPCRDIYYLLKEINELKADPSNEEKEILKEFNTLARLTHTVDNITLVPRGYNVKRGLGNIKDFWDLSLMDIKHKSQEPDKEEFTWWYEHKSIFDLGAWYNGEEVNPLYDGHSPDNVMPKKDSDLIACLREMNARIPIRMR